MSQVTIVRGADGSDFLSAADNRTDRHAHAVEVSVKALHELAALQLVLENDDISPPIGGPAREEDEPVGNRVDRISKIGILSPNAVQVIAEMAVCEERLGIDVSAPSRLPTG